MSQDMPMGMPPGLRRQSNPWSQQFLDENKERPGVVTMDSGLQYKVLKAGDGWYSPAKEDSECEVYYAGTTLSLTIDPINEKTKDWLTFDQKLRGKPDVIKPSEVINGWSQALQMMVVGDKWEVYIPADLGFGRLGKGKKVQGGDCLILRMELMKIKGKKTRARHCNFETREFCEPHEIETLDKWAKAPSDKKMDKEVKSLEKILTTALKPEKRKETEDKLKMMKEFQKLNVNKKGEL
mmetsp:Transcript_108543/g.188486  ORF Transcript_108543/g.188486 Transcript_108543/m.188486 type:complete len:238 (-) Transcript_108543:105-818(-)